MNPAQVTQPQKTAIALRLYKRVHVGDEVTGQVLGLGAYDCARCGDREKRRRGCHLDGRKLVAERPNHIDYHEPHRPDLDTILCCPLSVPGIHEHAREVYAALAMKDHGLHAYFGRPVAELPHALVSLYREADDALARFQAERMGALTPPKAG